ncbi:antitoxin Xre/MbcA/ParS toxin-binding domain-containing protein [Deinococcus marmoris]|uniref:antitoxin Xre/MbcA/ParS toxin-binding domain-containing protein n=1 Tax=Deinococcus marmoris TaxID=249408 RepID=UPI00068A918F|nr:antitoxin Xre-like helix-turn-helix domain-containing protein [Deinococcus marmoris]
MSRVSHALREPLLNQQVPDITDPATLQRLSRGLSAGIRMLEQLQLNREQQAWLLGLSSRSLQRARTGNGPELTQDQLTRLSLVVGIYKALHILYDDATADGWVSRANRRHPFAGQTPMDYMSRGGIPAMYEVRRLLDADRSGMFSVTPEARKAASNFATVVDL